MKKKVELDFSRADAMTEEERHAAATADPDAQPMTEEEFRNLKPRPRAFVIRRALRLTQEEFASKFQIPLGTLRDWEQGRKEPDAAARAYLKAIAGDPDTVAGALEKVANLPASGRSAA
jgi:putative transcriptional regulator